MYFYRCLSFYPWGGVGMSREGEYPRGEYVLGVDISEGDGVSIQWVVMSRGGYPPAPHTHGT